MAIPIQTSLSELRVLFRKTKSIASLPESPTEAIYPFLDYVEPEPDWVKDTGSPVNGFNRDLEIIFPIKDRIPNQDTTRLVRFHERGPTLEALVDVLKKFYEPNNLILKTSEHQPYVHSGNVKR